MASKKGIAVTIIILAAITDWYDGWLARKFNYITASGKFLDPLADKVLTSSAFIAFTILGVLELWMVLVIIIRDFLITFLRLYAEFKNKSFSTSKSAKWKTFFQMFFIYYLLAISVLMTVPWIYEGNIDMFYILTNKLLIYFTMLFVTLFTLITGVQYLFRNRKLILSLFTIENKYN